MLKRHKIPPDSDQGRRIIRYVEQKQPNNPGGYLEAILQENQGFDPEPDGIFEQSGSGPIAISNAIKRLGFNSNK